MSNPYSLYSGKIGLDAATIDIDAAICRAHRKYPNKADAKQAFKEMILPVLDKHRKLGAYDTMSRDLVWEYLLRCYQ